MILTKALTGRKVMKLINKKAVRVLAVAIAAGLATTSTISSAPAASKKVFNIWWYSKDNTPNGQTWAAALTEFKKNHPELDVKFELKTFEGLNNAGAQILNSNAAPDITEYNKGNGTAGLASKAGLLTDLTSYAAKYKWNLPSSVALYGQYDKGLMGTGKLYGVPTYGEYVSIFYNKDLFAKNGVTIPTTMDALEADMAKFKDAGVIPMEMGGGDYQSVHNIYALAVSKANQTWINSFQLFKGKPIDATTDANIRWAAETLVKWDKAGYFEPNASGVKADDAVAEFQSGKAAMMIGGSWLDGSMQTKISTFSYGKFLVPGTLTVGSAGNLLVIPTKSKNKDLAAEFINMTLSKKYQNYLGNAGGLPLFADPAAIANPGAILTATPFGQAVKKNALAMYPDWPVPGYYEILLSNGTSLLSSGDVDAYMKATGAFYNAGRPKA
jgi:raffinose/stachyose/melibiose transport system substrate-binding protein